MERMKKLLTILLIVLSFTLNAQQYVDIVKIQPLSMIANSATFEWEHIENCNALTVTIGLPINGSTKKDWFNAPSKLHTYNIRAGYRHYTSNTLQFYIEPYVKCQTIDWDSKLKQGWTEGYLFTTNAGFSLGYQATWKHFIVDIYPIGFEIGRMNGRLDTYSKTSEDADFMEQYVSKLSNKLPNNSPVHFSRYDNKVEAVLNLKTYYWIRSGISIGYRF